jgi:hypothetical protein
MTTYDSELIAPRMRQAAHLGGVGAMTLTLTLKGFVTLYRSLGLNPFPLTPGSKIPAIPWETQYHLQSQKFEHEFLWKDNSGVGVVCGMISNDLVVLDFEIFEDAVRFPWWNDWETLLRETIIVATPHTGCHVWLLTVWIPNRKTNIAAGKLDLLGSHGYATAPPTKIDHSLCLPSQHNCPHKGTGRYEIISRPPWKLKRLNAEINLEEFVFARCKQLGWNPRKISDLPSIRHIANGRTTEGIRHDSLKKYVQHLAWHDELPFDLVLERTLEVNQGLAPTPKPEKEVKDLVVWVFQHKKEEHTPKDIEFAPWVK